MIPFNIAPFVGTELLYVKQAIAEMKISGDGKFTKKCNEWLEKKTKSKKVLLTTSCTHALEMAAILCTIKPGDEVIMPSYTFVSTANAFVLRGAKIIFVDIRPNTMNINEKLIENAITEKTKVVVPVHYAGVACEMDAILDVAREYDLKVVEDAAQGIQSTYKGKALGGLGDFGCFSFHETKNFSMGEGGALLIKDFNYFEKSEIIREKGTNRSKFFRGQIDKYTWVDMGSSYLPSDINAAYLWGQLEVSQMILGDRMSTWKRYHEAFEHLEKEEKIERPFVPIECEHNAHMYYIKCKDMAERNKLIQYLKEKEIQAVFHYVPLHSSPAGKKFGEFIGEDEFTTKESERLVRLPLYYGIEENAIEYVIEKVCEFYGKEN